MTHHSGSLFVNIWCLYSNHQLEEERISFKLYEKFLFLFEVHHYSICRNLNPYVLNQAAWGKNLKCPFIRHCRAANISFSSHNHCELDFFFFQKGQTVEETVDSIYWYIGRKQLNFNGIKMSQSRSGGSKVLIGNVWGGC